MDEITAFSELLKNGKELAPILTPLVILFNAWVTRGVKIALLKQRVEIDEKFVSKAECEKCVTLTHGKETV